MESIREETQASRGTHGNGSLDIIDVDQRLLVKSVPTGKAQAPAIDARGGRYYVSASVPPQLVTIDAATLEVTDKVPLTGPADLLVWDSKTGKVYVGHDDGKDLWVVDPTLKKVAATIALPGEAPEDLGFDAPHEHLFQSTKIGNIIVVVNVATGTAGPTWPPPPPRLHTAWRWSRIRGLSRCRRNGKLFS